MKKKIKLVIIIAVTIMGFINFNLRNTKYNNVSSIKLANIEVLSIALAEEDLLCYQTISSMGDGNLTHITYCQDCLPHLARYWSDQNYCPQ